MCDDENGIVKRGFATTAIHAGQEFNQWSNSEIVPPIVTSNSFHQVDPIDMKGYSYSRAANPTRSVLEKCLAELENGKFCLTFSSGCAAQVDVLHLLKTGDHIIACLESYGGTRTLFLHHSGLQGIEIDFVDTTNMLSVQQSIKSNTKLIWIETPSNPCLKVSDIKSISEIAHSRNDTKILVAIDNTLLTSYFQRPLHLGADIVIYSLTKYMNGHNDVLMGALVVNEENLYKKLRFIQTKYGMVPSPFDCYLVNRGLKTLSLRMDRHSENSLAVAKYLESHQHVVKVNHPGLLSHSQHKLSQKQSSGHCGLVSIQIEGTVTDAKKFVQSLRVFLSSESLGSFTSFAVLPASTSHLDVPQEIRNQLEIFDTTIRLSVGLENIEDLIQDLKQAFNATYP